MLALYYLNFAPASLYMYIAFKSSLVVSSNNAATVTRTHYYTPLCYSTTPTDTHYCPRIARTTTFNSSNVVPLESNLCTRHHAPQGQRCLIE